MYTDYDISFRITLVHEGESPDPWKIAEELGLELHRLDLEISRRPGETFWAEQVKLLSSKVVED